MVIFSWIWWAVTLFLTVLGLGVNLTKDDSKAHEGCFTLLATVVLLGPIFYMSARWLLTLG